MPLLGLALALALLVPATASGSNDASAAYGEWRSVDPQDSRILGTTRLTIGPDVFVMNGSVAAVEQIWRLDDLVVLRTRFGAVHRFELEGPDRLCLAVDAAPNLMQRGNERLERRKVNCYERVA